jgi:hypothetical protein
VEDESFLSFQLFRKYSPHHQSTTPTGLESSAGEKMMLEQKRAAREEQRARLAAQMAELEAEQRAEDLLLNGGNGVAEPASAPTSPLGRLPNSAADRAPGAGAPAPIGQGRENGAKSMPASRRTSGYGGTFGMDKLSLSVLEHGRKDWADQVDDLADDNAQSK